MPGNSLTGLQRGRIFTEPLAARFSRAQLQASGAYQYFRDQVFMPIYENWQSFRGEDGSRLIQSQRDATEYGSRLWVQSRESDGVMGDFQVQWQQHSTEPGSTYHLLEADYRLQEGRLRVRRFCNDQLYETDNAMDATGIKVSPLMRVYVGDTLYWLYHNGGTGDVLMPWIQQPDQIEQLLDIQLSQRCVKRLSTDVLSCHGSQIPCVVYQYLGDQYDQSTRFWVDESHLLREYRWLQHQSQWRVVCVID